MIPQKAPFNENRNTDYLPVCQELNIKNKMRRCRLFGEVRIFKKDGKVETIRAREYLRIVDEPKTKYLPIKSL